MPTNREEHNRRSIRLQHYDYSQPGYYFVTICTQDKKWMFGEIVNDEMHLNETGQIIQSTWNTISERFPRVELDAYVVMPNHIHGIIIFTGTGFTHHRTSSTSNVPARFRQSMHAIATFRQTQAVAPPHPRGAINLAPTNDPPLRGGANQSPTLGEVIRVFKGAATHQVRTSGTPDFAWQHKYYEHVIHNDADLDRIRQYIINNPARWTEDRLNIQEGIL